MTSRRHVHTRSIRAEVFVREDGLWDLEAELIDTKARDFLLASGMRTAGTAIHRMQLTVTIDPACNVVGAEAHSLDHPYPGHCGAIEPAYHALIGLNLLRGFRRAVRERLGGTAGCTHLTELTDVLPTAAIQAFAGEVIKNRDSADEPIADEDGTPSSDGRKPFQLDRCYALRTDGPAVAQFYPRWYHAPAHQDTSEKAAEPQT